MTTKRSTLKDFYSKVSAMSRFLKLLEIAVGQMNWRLRLRNLRMRLISRSKWNLSRLMTRRKKRTKLRKSRFKKLNLKKRKNLLNLKRVL